MVPPLHDQSAFCTFPSFKDHGQCACYEYADACHQMHAWSHLMLTDL